MRKPYGFAFGTLLAASVVFLSAQVGGFPSRPRFQTLLVGTGTAPTQVGEVTFRGNVDGAHDFIADNDSTGVSNQARLIAISENAQVQIQSGGSSRTAALITGGTVGATGVLKTFGAIPLEFGTGNTLAATISAAQVFDFVNPPTVAGGSISGDIFCNTACDISTLAVGSSAYIAGASTENLSSDVSMGDTTHYIFTNPPSGWYELRGCINLTAVDGTQGFQLEFGQASGSAGGTIALNGTVNAIAFNGGGAWDLTHIAQATMSTTSNNLCWQGLVDPTGTFGLRWRQNTTDVDAITILIGRANMSLTRIDS